MTAYAIMTLIVFGTFVTAAVLFVFLFARKVERPHVLRTGGSGKTAGREPRHRRPITPIEQAPPPKAGVPRREPPPTEETYNPATVRMVVFLFLSAVAVVGFIHVASTRAFQDLALLVIPALLLAFLGLFYWLRARERSSAEWRKWGKAHKAGSVPGDKTQEILGSPDDRFEGRNPPNSRVRADQLKQKGIYYRIP